MKQAFISRSFSTSGAEYTSSPKTRKAVLFSSNSDHWASPVEVKRKLQAEYNLDFDPAPLGNEYPILSDNGLLINWTGRRVFVNPPYSQIEKWLAKYAEPDIAVYLLPARTDTRWFHNIVLPNARHVIFIRGRLRFGNAKHNAPFPSIVCVFINGVNND